MSSTRSRVYLFHLVPARIQVRWTMTAAAKTAGTSEFTCTVELIMNPLLRFLGGTSGLSPAIRRHTLIETGASPTTSSARRRPRTTSRRDPGRRPHGDAPP
jgi:hypothetical protein